MKEYEWAVTKDGWTALVYDHRKKSPPKGKYVWRKNNETYYQATANFENADFDSAEQAVNWLINKYDDAEQ